MPTSNDIDNNDKEQNKEEEQEEIHLLYNQWGLQLINFEKSLLQLKEK